MISTPYVWNEDLPWSDEPSHSGRLARLRAALRCPSTSEQLALRFPSEYATENGARRADPKARKLNRDLKAIGAVRSATGEWSLPKEVSR